MAKIDYAATSLGDEELDTAYETALAAVRAESARPEENLIGGRAERSQRVVERFDPCLPTALAGSAYAATPAQVDAAIDAARSASRAWRRMPFAERNELLRRGNADFAAELTTIAAIISAETGKTRLESYGEAQEVLDMVEHYTALFAANDGYVVEQAPGPGETNLDVLLPYGTFAVISPFNFPVALAVGMSVAALVTGNTVVLKPSDKTPRSTGTMARIFARHLPDGVLNVLHGGADVGAALAAGDVDGIAFTGSAEVGWGLTEVVGPRGLPRPVLAEMGGQNPAIVSAAADVDAAASGIVRSAFGLSGQKCSACRRVVVDEQVADELIDAVVARAGALVVGDPAERATNLGPVIDETIAARIDAALETAGVDGTVLTGGRVDREGHFYAPMVVTDLPIGHELTRAELFAPFLTITRVAGLEAAIAEANAVPYGLSAGIFSRDEAEVERFFDEIEAGVTYANRASGATTGAWPGAQSFAGWKRSGITGKGGLGVHYLQGFMREQSRTIVSTQ